MLKRDWKAIWTAFTRSAAAIPAAGAVLGVAMAAGSAPRPDVDRTAEAVARTTGGDFGPRGLEALLSRLTPAQQAEAKRHDPLAARPALYGLTPGWESLTLAGKPGLEPGETGLKAQQMNAALPVASGALRPALPFVFKGGAEDRRRALRCLTQAVYYEAALEPDAGQAAVAQVVLNRVRHPAFPKSVCGVVYQGAARRTGCQFSFTCSGVMRGRVNQTAWSRARDVASKALSGSVYASVGNATHFHTTGVAPAWRNSLVRVNQVGSHLFYRFGGRSGSSNAFTYAARPSSASDQRLR